MLGRQHGTMAAMNRAVTVGLVLFIAAIPLLPDIETKVEATLLTSLVLLVGLYVHARRGSHPTRTSLDLPGLTLLLAATLATIASVDRFGSFFPSALRGEGLLTFAGYVIAALAASRLDRRDANTVIAAALVGGSLVGAIALTQFYGLPFSDWLGIQGIQREGRTPGTLGNPFFLGGYVSLVLPMGVAVAALARGEKARWLYTAASTLLFAAAVTSQTRAAWGALAGAGVLLVILLPHTPQIRRRLIILAAIGLVTALLLDVTNPHVSFGRRVTLTFDPSDSSLAQRLYVWKHTLPMIVKRPLLGWGFGALQGRFPDAGSPEWMRLYGFRIVGIDTPHTETLHFAFSIGLIGLAAYVWVWVVVVSALRSALRHRTGSHELAAGFLASLLGYGLWLQLGWSHMGPANVFWVLAGTAVALGREEPSLPTDRRSPAGRSAGTAR